MFPWQTNKIFITEDYTKLRPAFGKIQAGPENFGPLSSMRRPKHGKGLRMVARCDGLPRGESRDAGERLAFEELEGRAAAGGDVAHLGGLAALLDGAD